MGVKFGVEEGTFGPLLHTKFHPIGATCRPCGVKNPKIGMSNLNNRRFALRAKLPVNKRLSCHREGGARNMYIRHYVSPADAWFWFNEKLGKDAWRRPIYNPLAKS